MKKDYLKYLAALLIYGTNGVVASMISLNSAVITLFRSSIGALILIIIFFISRNKLSVFRYPKDLIFIAISGIAMAADWLFLFEAYQQIGVSLSILINYTGPVFVIIFSPVFFKEKITPAKIIALILTLIGVALISGQIVIEGLNIRGLFCACMSSLSYVILVITDKLCSDVEGMENSMVQLFFTAVTVIIFVGISQGFNFTVLRTDWFPLIWLGIVNTGIGCLLYFSSIIKLPAQTVAVMGYIEPLSSVIISALILKEKMTFLQIAGAVLIIGGAIYGEISGRRTIVNLSDSSGQDV